MRVVYSRQHRKFDAELHNQQSFFSGRKMLDVLHLKDTLSVPAIIIFAFIVFGGIFVWFANWSTDYTRMGYSRAQVTSTMMIQSVDRPPGMRLMIVLEDGKSLQVSTRNARRFAMNGDVVCVELRQRAGSEQMNAVLAGMSRCSHLPEELL